MRETTSSPLAPSDHLTTRLLEQRIIVLDGELDDHGGTRLCSQLFLLSAEDPRADISLWINSPGGSVPAMLAIHDAIRLIPNDVSTLALGLACSAGQFLLTAGTHGKRYALRHSRILMHQGSAGIGGTAVDIELQAEDLRHTVETVLGLIATYTGQPSNGSARTPGATAGTPRSRRWTTASSTGSSTRSTASDPNGSPAPASGARSEHLHDPQRDPHPPARRPGDGRLQPPAQRADRLPRHRDRRRGVQRADRPDPAPRVRQRGAADRPLHQLPRRSLTATFAVYDAMEFVRAPIATTCIGQACSTAAILLAAGAPGRRSILPHARVLLHQPSARSQGAIPDLILEADEVIRLRAEAERVLSAPHRAAAGHPAARHRPRPDLHPRGGGGVRAGRPAGGLPHSGRGLTRLTRYAASRISPGGGAASVECWRRRSSEARWVTSTSGSPRAPEIAASTSEDGSLRPRSTSDRYCGEMPASAAASTRVSPRRRRRCRSRAPTTSRQSGSGRGATGPGAGVTRTRDGRRAHAVTLGAARSAGRTVRRRHNGPPERT